MKNKTVFFQGTFDILNVCHIKCFKTGKSHGDLIVGLNSDYLIETYKHRIPSIPYETRAEILRALKYVDKVVKCEEFSPMKQLKKLKPDYYMLGKEWVQAHSEEIKFVKSYGGKIITTPNYRDLHSSDIRRRVMKNKFDTLL